MSTHGNTHGIAADASACSGPIFTARGTTDGSVDHGGIFRSFVWMKLWVLPDDTCVAFTHTPCSTPVCRLSSM